MKILTIVGARPQFVKAAVLSRKIAERDDIDEIIVHTGQHYDKKMSQSFFDDLCIPTPTENLEIGSGPHGKQTGKMLEAIELQCLKHKPDCLLVYGDTNSTLAGALAAAKLHIPIAHVEAGLRSFNRAMPEELNRIMTDHISSWLFTPSQLSVNNLAKEGISKGVTMSGDIMYDAVLFYKSLAQEKSTILEKMNLESSSFILVTIHRAENTDDPSRLQEIFHGLQEITSKGTRVIIPLHPRTQKIIQTGNYSVDGLEIIEPIPYFDILQLLSKAHSVVTDSGGLQKEAFWLETPCITVRDETEWLETVEEGWNQIVGASSEKIVNAFNSPRPPLAPSNVYGSGETASLIIEKLLS